MTGGVLLNKNMPRAKNAAIQSQRKRKFQSRLAMLIRDKASGSGDHALVPKGVGYSPPLPHTPYRAPRFPTPTELLRWR